MKIYLNRPIKKEAWGGGSHFITGFYEYLDSNNVNVVFDLNHNDIDYILCLTQELMLLAKIV